MTVTVQHRSAKTSPSLSQDQRLAWIHELLTGTSESLPYGVAGMLLLLHAQALVRVVTFQTSNIDDSDAGMTIALGAHSTDVPGAICDLRLYKEADPSSHVRYVTHSGVVPGAGSAKESMNAFITVDQE